MSEAWLNGWARLGSGVLMGTQVHCAGCGKDMGTTCVAITADHVFPEIEPDWPFLASDCLVCKPMSEYWSRVEKEAERLFRQRRKLP